MGKFFLIVGALVAAGWYYFIGGAKLDEALVQQFYADEAHAMLSRDPEGLCKRYAGKLVVTQETLMMGQSTTQTFNRDQVCEEHRKAFKMFEEVGDKGGGTLTIDYAYKVEKIDMAPNQKSAVVLVSNTLNLGNGLMVFKTVSTDQLTREWGKVLVAKADVKTRTRMNMGALADPAAALVEK